MPSTLHEDMSSLISDASVWSSVGATVVLLSDVCVLICMLQEGADMYEGRSDDVFITTEMGDPDNTLQEQANSDASSVNLLRSSSTDYNPFPYEDGTEYAGEHTTPSSPSGQTSPPANDSSPEPSTPQSQPPSPPLADSSSPSSLRVNTSTSSSPTKVFSPLSEFSPFSELSTGSPFPLSSPGVLVEHGGVADAESLDARLHALSEAEAIGPESSDEEDAEKDLDAGSDGSWEDIIDGLSLHE